MEIWLKYFLWLSQYDGLSEMSVGISLMFKRQIEEEADEKEEAEEFGCKITAALVSLQSL